MPGLDEEKLANRCDFAIGQYSERNAMIDSILKLYKQDFSTVESQADRVDIGGGEQVEMVKPGRGQAIVNKYQTAIWQQSDIALEVMPLRRGATRGEDKLCTNAELYLRGIIDESDNETRGAWKYGSSWWFLMGGMMTLKTLYFPQLRDTEQFPIKLFAPSAKDIYPIYANKRVLYVVERYDRYVMDLKEELEALWYSSGKRKVWNVPEFLDESGNQLEGTDEVEVKEYWDDTYHALLAGDVLVWNKEHGYPCIPYAIRYCLPTPMAEVEWYGRPVLASSEDAMKQEALLLTKLSSGAHTYFYPVILITTTDGAVAQLQTGPGMPTTPIKEGTQVQVINPTPNIALLQGLLGAHIGEIERNTLPQLMWSQPVSPVRTGYAEEFRFRGTEADLRFMSQQLAAGLAHAFSNVLKITEELAGSEGFSVYSLKPGQKRHELVTMGKDDIAGHHKVRVRLDPNLDTNLIQQMQIMRFGREASKVTGQQLLPDRWLRREIMRVADPVELEDMLNEELIASDPLVVAYKKKVAMDEYWKRHGVGKSELEELKEQAGMVQPEQPEIPMPMPPPAEGFGPPGAGPPGGEGMVPWGVPPEVMPPEMGGLGRAQQGTPEDMAMLAAAITGRPPGGV